MSQFRLFALNSFKRDAKKRWEVLLSSAYVEVAYCLINGVPLPEKYKDHDLICLLITIKNVHTLCARFQAAYCSHDRQPEKLFAVALG